MRNRSAVVRGNPNITSTSDQFYPKEPAPKAPIVDQVRESAQTGKPLKGGDAQPGSQIGEPVLPHRPELGSVSVAASEPDYAFPVLSGGFDRIVSRLYDIDADKEEQELTAALQSSERPSRSDYGTLVDVLDVAEDNARRAMALYVNAKVTDAAFELDALAITSSMRKEAVDALNEAKLDGEGKPIKGMKAITNDDVTAYISSQWADQWRRIELDRAKSKQMTVYLERLAELWKQRARDLGIMASNARQ